MGEGPLLGFEMGNGPGKNDGIVKAVLGLHERGVGTPVKGGVPVAAAVCGPLHVDVYGKGFG